LAARRISPVNGDRIQRKLVSEYIFTRRRESPLVQVVLENRFTGRQYGVELCLNLARHRARNIACGIKYVGDFVLLKNPQRQNQIHRQCDQRDEGQENKDFVAKREALFLHLSIMLTTSLEVESGKQLLDLSPCIFKVFLPIRNIGNYMVFLNKTDRRILTVAAIVLAIFSYFLYDDSLLFPDLNASKMEKIGLIYHSVNDVRLKSATSFSWSPAQKSNVHQKDSIFTGEGSEVAIQLLDGSVINLKENSLVTLNIKNGEMTLDLKYGDFVGELSQNSELKVKAGTEVFKLKGDVKSVLSINKSRTGQLGVKLQSGSAKLGSTQLEKQKSFLASKGAVKELPKPVIKLVTANRSTFTQWTPKDLIPLEWESEPVPEVFEAEIATDEGFKDIRWHQKTAQMIINAAIDSGTGKYFWRVKGLSSAGQVLGISNHRFFNVVRGGTPSILSPEAKKPLALELPAGTKEKQTEFKIKWKAEDRIRNFNYQIGADPDFTQILKDDVTAGKEVSSPELPSGTYFVRVRGEVRQGTFGDWSEIRQVDMKVTIAEGPAAPKLVKRLVEFDAGLAAKRGPSAVQAPEFQWTKPFAADSYRIEVSKDKKFRDSKVYPADKGETFVWNDYEPGDTFFRVYAVSKNKILSPPSEYGLVKVILNDPKIRPIKKLVATGKDPVAPAPTLEALVSWNPVKSAKKYVLEMDQNNDFTSPQRFEVKNESIPLAVSKPGKFNLRVRALNEKGEAISNYSTVEKLTYIYNVPLLTPDLLEPYNKTTMFMQKDTAPYLWLEWQNVPNASEYLIEISTAPDFSKPLLSAKTIVPRFLVKQKIPYGTVYWRVRALSENPDMHSKWTGNREFSILFNKNETFQ
jgi:hypothetical protein